jgi:hypothetical protein
MRPSIKRLLHLAHRWLGIAMCLLFAMWFVSGVVMMYVGYPKLTDAERLAHLPALAPDDSLLGPQAALARAGLAGPLKELRLAAASGGRPVYLAKAGDASAVIDARSGERLQAVDAARVLASARTYAGPHVRLDYLGTITEDAFTHSRSLDAHRPLHRVQAHDPGSTLLYVSGTTGEVVRDAPRAERLWNYLGAWIHWLYPLRGNAFDRYWADIVNWLSIAGIAMALSGTIVGILRWRFVRPYRSGSRSPYTGPMMRWHHLSGLLFALVTITWIFSGLMSMNPWRLFGSGAPAPRGEALALSAQDAAPGVLLRAAGGKVRELRWMPAPGQTIVLAQAAAGRPTVLGSRSADRVALDEGAVQAAVARLQAAPVLRVERLADYDLYYYAREAHTMTGGGAKPLPVLRMVFDDANQTWLHVDPHTGAVINRVDRKRRLSRWLFAMLHSWDWLPLLERRPLWDGLLIVLSLGGALLSATGVVIGWRRLGRGARRNRGGPAGTQAQAPAAPV